ncbi:DUF4873 domain-containing protein [Saccharomonospora xinjiangensis]|uniref:DUF4873 domain-containing protein n=1 Tax=Saccharomonospora xinjiangensis TaxID=75294 RepID=UPI00350E9175
MTGHDHDEDGYAGTATLRLGDTELDVAVQLRGHFQPIDGYYHWYGRIAADERVSELAGGRKREVEIRTPEGSASGELSDPDPWDRYRITGVSTPPFAVPTSLADLNTAD